MPQMSLEDVLQEAEAEAVVLRQHGHTDQAKTLERIVQKVRASAEEYLDWLNESNARIYTGRSERWLRGRFLDWEPRGLARWHHGRRQYRRIILEHRGNAEAAFAAGQRAALDAREAGRRAARGEPAPRPWRI
jgi:hypothetical protein